MSCCHHEVAAQKVREEVAKKVGHITSQKTTTNSYRDTFVGGKKSLTFMWYCKEVALFWIEFEMWISVQFSIKVLIKILKLVI